VNTQAASAPPVGAAAETLAQTLAALAGPDLSPRPGQLEAVAALIEQRQRVLVVQATGWGKSLVYWAATRALRANGAGPTIVISPLLALMRDQIQAAADVGLTAVTVNSSNQDDWDAIFAQLRADEVDVLLVSPERLANPKFADQALPLLANAGLLVIDEAHCISDWSDFRADYQRIARLLLRLAPNTPVLATTATANQRVTTDVAAQLGDDTLVLRGPLTRKSLQLAVVPGLDGIQRYAWVAQALADLSGSGIIYCLTVAAAESLAEFLIEQGHQVVAYTGQTEPEVRHRIEDQLRNNQVKAVVATSALGMGYDKKDLGFVLNVGSPASPVSYYQQVGRAGRAIDQAYGVLLPAGQADERIWNYFATATIPDPEVAANIQAALADGPKSIAELEAITAARRGRLELLLKQMRVDEAVDRQGSKWASTGSSWQYQTAKYNALIKVRAAEADLMRQYAAGHGCLMSILVSALDDPDPKPCGKCSVCTGQLPAPGQVPGQDHTAAAAAFLRRRTRLVEPRKLWPKGVARKGRITPPLAQGRAVAFADDDGYADLIAEVASPDAPASADMGSAVIAMLHRWRPARPAAIVPVSTGRNPRRLASLVAELSGQLNVPAAHAFEWDGGLVPDSVSSSAHVAHVEQHLRFDPTVADLFSGQPVLMVTESARTRWTLTVAGALLTEAGATSAVPLVIHLQP